MIKFQSTVGITEDLSQNWLKSVSMKNSSSHLRKLKRTFQTSVPGITGAVYSHLQPIIKILISLNTGKKSMNWLKMQFLPILQTKAPGFTTNGWSLLIMEII